MSGLFTRNRLIGLAIAFSLRCLADLLVLMRASHVSNAAVLGRLAASVTAVEEDESLAALATSATPIHSAIDGRPPVDFPRP